MFAKHSLFNSSLYRSLGIPPSVLGKVKICLLNTHVSPPHFFPDYRRWSMTIIHVNTNPERTNYPLITVLLQPTRLTMLTWSIQQFDIKYRCQKLNSNCEIGWFKALLNRKLMKHKSGILGLHKGLMKFTHCRWKHCRKLQNISHC